MQIMLRCFRDGNVIKDLAFNCFSVDSDFEVNSEHVPLFIRVNEGEFIGVFEWDDNRAISDIDGYFGYLTYNFKHFEVEA